MFEIGWTELLLIGIVALIVIGPKDLPDMFRTMGRFTAKMRSMAREFSRAMETAAKESGANDIAADLKAMTSSKSMGLDAVKDAASKFEKWDPLKNAAKPSVPVPPVAAPPVVAAPAAPSATAVRGPATQALMDTQAAKKAIAAEAAEKLRALNAAPAVVSKPAVVAEPAAKPARKPRAPRVKKDV